MSEVYYIVKTNYGIFYLKFSVIRDKNTNEFISFMINIGSKDYKCIQI